MNEINGKNDSSYFYIATYFYKYIFGSVESIRIETKGGGDYKGLGLRGSGKLSFGLKRSRENQLATYYNVHILLSHINQKNTLISCKYRDTYFTHDGGYFIT